MGYAAAVASNQGIVTKHVPYGSIEEVNVVIKQVCCQAKQLIGQLNLARVHACHSVQNVIYPVAVDVAEINQGII
ncbi:Unknown protein sequence [Pseudomonas amygdali pv. lachrymans]|uniref:Uncharacterized protein n=1 Tax=Pseudomonas amygdali pv. lachrymans TaxID=53707 RepID=A0ABR5KSU7_PSEAV|nr:Unknown protein sequence [Pseudomonas amygdali pv. lachrymans]